MAEQRFNQLTLEQIFRTELFRKFLQHKAKCFYVLQIWQLVKTKVEELAKAAAIRIMAGCLWTPHHVGSVFPGEWKGVPLKEIIKAAKKGDASARKAKKLLTDKRFNKGDNRK